MQAAANTNVRGNVPKMLWAGRQVTVEQLSNAHPYWITAELEFFKASSTVAAISRASFRLPIADHDLLIIGMASSVKFLTVTMYHNQGPLQNDEIPVWTMSGGSLRTRKPFNFDAPITVPAQTQIRLEAVNDDFIDKARIVLQCVWMHRR